MTTRSSHPVCAVALYGASGSAVTTSAAAAVLPEAGHSGDATVLVDSSRLVGAAVTSMTKSGASGGFCGGL